MKKFLLILLGLFFVGCSVNPSKVDKPEKFMKTITYVKDERTGLCFSIIATRKSFATYQSGVGMACVPCSSVEKFLE